MQIVKEEFVTNAEALDLLQKRQKQGVLGYEQQLTFEYLQKNVLLTLKESKDLRKDLSALGFLNEDAVVQLVNVLPVKEDDVRFVLLGSSDEQVKQVVEVMKKHVK